MIDHLLGRPSTKLKRVQVFAVIAFWIIVLKKGNKNGPNIKLIRSLSNQARGFTPWQLCVALLTAIYGIRHLDSILGVGAPEPLARMYSRPFYRVTWIVTALDCGFASAQNVRPKWIRDIASIFLSLYYLVYANEADEKLRKYRAFCTVDMMRVTWHKTTNPYIRAFTALTWHRPKLVRSLFLPRPELGAHARRPSQAWLFYDGDDSDLRYEDQLYLDICGGGYICMTPEHHEERLRQLAKETRRPVLAINYCKAPEHPYPFALEECYDVYRSLHESRGKIIGMSGSSSFNILLSGDSAGGNLACGTLLKILEYPQPHIKSAYARRAAGSPGSAPPPLPKPIGLLLAYPSLNFGFTSWIKPEFLRVLRQQSEMNLHSMGTPAQTTEVARQTAMVSSGSSPLNPEAASRRASTARIPMARPTSAERRAAADQTASARKKGTREAKAASGARAKRERSFSSLAQQAELHLAERARFAEAEPPTSDDPASEDDHNHTQKIWSGIESDQVDMIRPELHRSPSMDAARAEHEERQRILNEYAQAEEKQASSRSIAPINTRLTMTSMAGYFQDRILTQSMLRAMAILYIGPRKQPDFDHDYFLSPLVAPSHLLAEFPPVMIICGEKDPLCDDTVVMAGKIREAKMAKKLEIERKRAGRSARFGESLRMSQGGPAAMQHDPIEDEDVEDWVQMRIIEGWSHGFLQMSSLLPEAKQVITFLGTWAVEIFEMHAELVANQREASNNAQLPAAQPSKGASQQRGRGPPSVATALRAEEDEDDEPLSFIPRAQRSPSHSARKLPSSPNSGKNPGSPMSLAAVPNGLHSPGAEGSLDNKPMGDVRTRNTLDAGFGTRRGSKAGTSEAEQAYKALLVKEDSLMQRRREEAVFGLGETPSAVVSDEENVEEGHVKRGRRSHQ